MRLNCESKCGPYYQAFAFYIPLFLWINDYATNWLFTIVKFKFINIIYFQLKFIFSKFLSQFEVIYLAISTLCKFWLIVYLFRIILFYLLRIIFVKLFNIFLIFLFHFLLNKNCLFLLNLYHPDSTYFCSPLLRLNQ